MNDIYFSFEWIIGEPGIYFAFRDSAARCECEIVELNSTPYKRDGFEVMPFVIRATRITNLEQFRKIIGEDRLLNWLPSSKVTFKRGKPPTTSAELAAMSGEYPMRWLDTLRACARQNQKLRANKTSNEPSSSAPPSVE